MHITSSRHGLRFVFTADIKEGNLADNQIVFAQKLGCKADNSCIDATRNSFSPKEEDILYINEELLFDYYDEDFDREYTPKYREKETQPINRKIKHSFYSCLDSIFFGKPPLPIHYSSSFALQNYAFLPRFPSSG